MSKTQAAWQIQYSSFQGPAPSRKIDGRRLNSCFCRKAFKEIGRDWGRHTNATDDDDDNAVVAVEAPTPAKKKALPAFALDFGNGA